MILNNPPERAAAWAAATDAADRSARKGGRVAWNPEDAMVACDTFRALWPEERDRELIETRGARR